MRLKYHRHGKLGHNFRHSHFENVTVTLKMRKFMLILLLLSYASVHIVPAMHLQQQQQDESFDRDAQSMIKAFINKFDLIKELKALYYSLKEKYEFYSPFVVRTLLK